MIRKRPLEPLSLWCRPAEEQMVDWVLLEMLGQERRRSREVTVCQPDLAPIDMRTGRRPPGGGVAARGRRAADIPPVLTVSCGALPSNSAGYSKSSPRRYSNTRIFS